MYKLLPYPKQFLCTEEKVSIELDVCKINKRLAQDPAISALASRLGLKLQLDDSLPSCSIALGQANASPAPKNENSYLLKIDNDGIFITGSDRQGLIYGLITLWQIIENKKGFYKCAIVDYPSIGVRGHFDDVSRKRISTLEGFKKNIERLAYFKINYYAIYIEDVLHLKSFPDIGAGRGKLMPWEVREIVEYAKSFGMEIIPFFQMIGHCENMLELPNYEALAREVSQHPSSLDPKKEQVKVYLNRAVRDMLELFDCKYIGMGFDETQGVGEDEFIDHANFCADILAEYGRQGIVWIDMFHNHFGVEKIARLNSNIIPCNWQYGTDGGEVPYYKEFSDVVKKSGQRLFGFGGYSNWCKFIPVFEATKDHMDIWSKTVVELTPYKNENGIESFALFYSQWGDNGYENSRDLIWDLYAYSAETSWYGEGKRELRESFEDRFQTLFYGEKYSKIEELVLSFEKQVDFPADFYWTKHRFTYEALRRYAIASPQEKVRFEKDLSVYTEFLDGIKKISAEKNDLVIRHFELGLRLTIGVINRLLAAYEVLDEATIRRITEELVELKVLYLQDWLSTNKYENVEVSLKVFDKVLASFQEQLQDVAFGDKYIMVDMQKDYNTMFIEVAGVPIGKRFFNAIPFSFADENYTHVRLDMDKEISYEIEPALLKDAHVICCVPMPNDMVARPVLEISFLCDEHEIYSEELNDLTHVIDWFAPLGEHIWAGGGFRYADKSRVKYACSPGDMFGLMDVSGFKIPENQKINKVRLKSLTDKDLCIFAITLEL